MSIRNIYASETWDKVYQAFENVNFTSFDFDTIKESLLQYIKLYYKEHYNDFIESSELIAIIESFAYIAEQLSYRIDIASHENFITTAQRKQSILKLAKLISYKISRNIPSRGLVKINSITTTERIIDSQGNNLSGLTIFWNDANNSNWKEQFFLIMNRVLTGKFGQPQKVFQVDDVSMQLYSFNNSPNSFVNGVSAFTVDTGTESFPMEVVPSDLDANGPFERAPDINSQMSLVYAIDGLGDASDYTGFLMFIKQGSLVRTEYLFDISVPNRTIELSLENVNQTDIWLNRVDSNGIILDRWEEVEALSEQNLMFNTIRNRKKFEIETLENDRIRLIFGDGDFSDIPFGRFYIWTRQSINRSLVIQKNKLVNQPMNFIYSSSLDLLETCAITFSSTATIQNSSASETIEHVRQSAPATYYAQNRMVNAQDYNTFMLKDSSILRINTVNRTFAGQPKYIDWNDASGNYENIKLFGDDLELRYESVVNTINTSVSSKSLIDTIIEPLLASTGMLNTLIHVGATDPATKGVISAPRRKFIEDNRLVFNGTNLLEKTKIQGALDQHYYGEPLSYVIININNVDVTHALIPDPILFPSDDSHIYQETLPRTFNGHEQYQVSDQGSGLQNSVAQQPRFGLKYNRTMPFIGINTLTNGTLNIRAGADEVFTIEVAGDSETLFVTSNVRGAFPDGTIGIIYSAINPNPPIDFLISGTTSEPGNAFIIRLPKDDYPHPIDPLTLLPMLNPPPVPFISTPTALNLNGQWEIINGTVLTGGNPNIESSIINDLVYDPSSPDASWLIWIEELTSVMGDVVGYNVHYRELQLIAKSMNTKFWYNSSTQILDSQTRNVVHDTIRVLRSNLLAGTTDRALGRNENYDVIAAIKDRNGVIDPHSLEIIPTDALNQPSSGDTMPDSILQFEDFANNEYEYALTGDVVIPTSTPTVDSDGITTATFPGSVTATFMPGAFTDVTKTYTRTQVRKGLDFMWQHFSPYTNIIDPSVSNIHDAFILSQGYYNNVVSYLRGTSTNVPIPPTPLELRNSYGYLLENKMLSDTVVLHSGKIKLLFGDLAEPQLRATFKVIKSPTASLTNEKIKSTILEVINTYFGIENWDFGETFYVTELLGLIHQRLPTEIASVVLVPLYAVNSFGSLFTVQSGFDEILQSAAKINNIEIVEAFTPSVLRQNLS